MLNVNPAGKMRRVSVLVVGLVLLIAASCFAQQGQTNARTFFANSVGEWVGTCRQSTDGKLADDKYFHASIKQVDANTYSGQFDYYRMDPQNGKPLPIGQSTITIAVAPDGTATSTIQGKGIVMVDGSPKDQTHQLSEVLTPTPDGRLVGKGKGSISVSGMPLGAGKGGKVKDANDVWAMNNGVLTLSQSIKVGFKALVFTKSFQFDAQYTAKHGTNIAEVMPATYAQAPNH